MNFLLRKLYCAISLNSLFMGQIVSHKHAANDAQIRKPLGVQFIWNAHADYRQGERLCKCGE